MLVAFDFSAVLSLCIFRMYNDLSLPFLCSDLDPQLQNELKKYLEARGIGESLLNFLVCHLQKKEHGQYVNWLQKLESTITLSE